MTRPARTVSYRLAAACAILCGLAAAILVTLAIGLAFAQDAKPLRGVALVVGNGEYEHIAPLANPVSDARAVENLLNGLGFETDVATDRDARRLRRDLEGFADDAEGADVAVLYYSGHGIEAGGENFLVPVDADVGQITDASESLVPVASVIEELRQKVPVVIVMLDACRNSPFPPGAMISLKQGEPPAPVAAAGLGLTRGVTIFRNTPDKPGNVGAVIAFAAEPGKVALDGEPGGNSPYAAAIIRHLSAMAGEEFGTVMRMVAEEVYLKTGGRQRPWVNESMRRLLYFGERPKDAAGDEGDILAERRQLLLTIAALPEAGRRQVEQVAARSGVPMDGLYAMMRALGQDVPADPGELDKLLSQQADRLKQVLADRAAISSTDPEIARLITLSQRAVEEGALSTAIALNEQAKARVAALGDTVARAEELLRQRRREFADVYARSARAYELKLDFIAAAADYARAYAEISAFDPRLAFDYKTEEAAALAGHADYAGGSEAFRRAVDAGRQALAIGETIGDPVLASSAHHNLAVSLAYLGNATHDAATTRVAIAEYRKSMSLLPREQLDVNWAATSANLATALRFLGDIEGGTSAYQEAVAAYRQALSAMDPAAQPNNWQAANDGLGIVLGRLGAVTRDRDVLIEAVTAHREALREMDKAKNPIAFAGVTMNLATAYMAVADIDPGYDFLYEGIAAYRSALTVFNETATPNFWAIAQDGLGTALQALGERRRDTAVLTEAVAVHRAALRHRSREKNLLEWSMTQENLGDALKKLGGLVNDPSLIDEAVAAYRAAIDATPRTAQPRERTNTTNKLTELLLRIDITRANRATLSEAAAAYRSVAEAGTREAMPAQWSRMQFFSGAALFQFAELSRDVEATDAYRRAVDGFRASLSVPKPADRFQEGSGEYNLGLALLRLGQMQSDRGLVAEAVDRIAAASAIYRRGPDRSNDAVIARQLADARKVLSTMK